MTSLISSVINPAACVGLDGGESFSPQACLSGEGTAGVVGLVGKPAVRKRGVSILSAEGDAGWIGVV